MSNFSEFDVVASRMIIDSREVCEAEKLKPEIILRATVSIRFSDDTTRPNKTLLLLYTCTSCLLAYKPRQIDYKIRTFCV